MSAPVHWKRSEPVARDVMIGEPVRGQTWRELAMLLHWLRGHGMEVIPAHSPQLHLATTSTEKLYYRVQPQGLAIARIWIFGLHQEGSASVSSFVDVTLPGGSSVTLTPSLPQVAASHVVVETLAAKSAAEADWELAFQRSTGSTAAVWVESVACYELPRAVLSMDATDLGVDFETVRPRALLFDHQNRSIGAVAENLQDTLTKPRRMLWEWSGPLLVSDPGAAINPTAWVDLFTLPVPVSPRRVLTTDTTFDATFCARALLGTAGDKFDIRATSGNSGNTVSLTVTSTTEAWLTNSTLTLDCEDVGQVDGVPSGGLETVQVAVRRTAGAGKVSVRSLALWEAS